jgi:hypothetical protein
VSDDNNYTLLTDEDLDTLETYASLKYSLYEISLMMDLDVDELRQRMMNKNDPIFRRYTAGKLKSELKFRMAVLKKAESGEQWAVQQLEEWKMKQTEDELGCHE